jgi:NADH-quinone oxidoreductase subunit I
MHTAPNGYFGNIRRAARTLWGGLRLSWRHFRRMGRREHATPGEVAGIADSRYFLRPEGSVTIQYPAEKIPLPDHGRYRLHMEAEDCIVCDKCARICPVDCITIDGFKAVDDLGLTSDGSRKRLELAVFDIDMAKCCYCGLCTTVCPTECLTMTKVYDFSEYDRDQLVYHFGLLSPEAEAEKRARLAALEAEKLRPQLEPPDPDRAVPQQRKGLPLKKPLIPPQNPSADTPGA